MNSFAALQGLWSIPSGLLLEHALLTADTLTLVLKNTTATAACPLCGQPSHRVHSRYQRKLADLPIR
jgi:hypothetical protein